MREFSNRDVDPDSVARDRVSREQNRRDAPDDEGIDLGGEGKFSAEESIASANEFLRRVQAHFSGSVPQPPEEAHRAKSPGSNGSPKAARHRLHRRDRRDRRDRDHASYGRSAAPGGNEGRAAEGKPAAGGSENARVASTSGRSAPSARGLNPGAYSSADSQGHSAASAGHNSRAVDRKPAAGGSENARASSTSGRSAAADDGGDRAVKKDGGGRGCAAAGGDRQLEVSIKNRGWLYLLSSICPGKREEMFTLFDEVEERHRRLVEESDGSEVAELLADEVMTCWLERMKSSMQEQFDSQSDDTRIVARTRATESATKRLLGALKVYHDYKSAKM